MDGYLFMLKVQLKFRVEHIEDDESRVSKWRARMKASQKKVEEAKELVAKAHQEVEASRATGDDVSLASAEAQLASANEAERQAAMSVEVDAMFLGLYERRAIANRRHISQIEAEQEAHPSRLYPRRG